MCIFCKIINKDIPAHVIYEDETVIAILDISQVTLGHTLIIPKKHVENFLDCPNDILNHVVSISQKIGREIMTKLNANGMNIISNVHEIAGQSVMHFHVHLVPRYDVHDGISITFRSTENVDYKDVLKKIRST